MKKIRFAALLFLLAALLCISVCASGVQVVDSGTWGNINWTLYDDGELQISGSGDMPYAANRDSVPWAKYKKKIRRAAITQGVTSVGRYAFYGCSTLTSVTIPEGVTEIGGSAFEDCSSLTNVTIPEGVTEIGGYAFFGCSSLSSVTIPEKVSLIEDHMFYGCSSLISVTIPENVSEIGRFGFYGCSSLISVDIPESMTEISDYGFSECSSLTSVTIPESVTKIGYSVFEGCSSLTNVTVPDSIVEIDSSTFSHCSSLTSVTIPESVMEIGGYAFSGCSSLTDVTIPESVTEIGGYAFSGCSSLTSVTIPESMTEIGSGVFSSCSSLTSVTIPDSVASIGDSAFSNCSGLTGVIIPGSVTLIGDSAFSGCSGLASVTIPEGVTSIGNSAFYGCSSLTSVTIPEGVTLIGERAFYDCNGLTSVTIPESVTAIGHFAFAFCRRLASAEFLGNAPSLSNYVFDGANSSFIIYFHAGKSGWTSPTWNGYRAACIETPEEYSVLDGDNRNAQHIQFTLNSEAGTATVGGGYDGGAGGQIVIPDTVTKDGVSYRVIGIDAGAFQDNVYVKSVQLGSNLSSISAQPFYGCENLEEFRLSTDNDRYSVADGILYDYVGYNLYIYPAGKDMESFAVPDTVKTISAGAFCDAKNLRAVTVPDSVTSIGSEAFRGCTGLETVVLPFLGGSKSDANSFDYIFGDTWSFNYVLKDVTILGEPLKGGDFACSVNLVGGIERITLPACGETIPYSGFLGCQSLDTLIFSDIGAVMENGVLTIPGQVTSIGSDAFSDCLAIRQVHIPAGVQSISTSSFQGCDGLTGFTVAEDNPNYSSDKWGVLFNQDGSTLLQYPASRVWPYYNVPDGTVSISSYAFDTCKNLVNLYIPETVSRLSYSSVVNCPSTTLCVRLDSPADRYATSNNHRVWYIDNYTLQGIEVYSLPEQTAFDVGQVDFTGLYLAANYGGTRLQLDDYSISFGPGAAGIQTVNVMAGDKTASFEIQINGVNEAQLVEFDHVRELDDGEVSFAALYDANNRMLGVYAVNNIDGIIRIAVPGELNWTEAKLFILDSGTWSPRMMYTK